MSKTRVDYLSVLLLIIGCICSRACAQNYVGQILYRMLPPAGIEGMDGFAGLGAFAVTIAGGQAVDNGEPPGPASDQHALAWSPAGVPSDLQLVNPNSLYSRAEASDGVSVVGQGIGAPYGAGQQIALLWPAGGTAVNLTPMGYTSSTATDVSGNQQVGYGFNSLQNHTGALLWSGTAASAIDLNPPGYGGSSAMGTDGANQVGSGYLATGDGSAHALLWSGSADSVVDLAPSLPGITNTVALGVGGNQQAGYGFQNRSSGIYHALLWSGTSASAVDLNPTELGFTISFASATNGQEQVGYAKEALLSDDQAMLWYGSADSAIDLQDLIPGGATASLATQACSIDANGNIFGIAIGTLDNQSGMFAIEWSPVSEPAPGALGLLGGAALLWRRR